MLTHTKNNKKETCKQINVGGSDQNLIYMYKIYKNKTFSKTKGRGDSALM